MSRSGTYDPVYGFIPDDDFPEEQKLQTNADRLRAMSDEELAEFLAEYRCVHKAPHCRDANCVQCWLDWLKSPVEPGEVDNG